MWRNNKRQPLITTKLDLVNQKHTNHHTPKKILAQKHAHRKNPRIDDRPRNQSRRVQQQETNQNN